MKIRKNRSKRNTLDSIIHDNFLNMNKQLSRSDAILLDSGYYDTETWGGLRKCWKGFKIAKVDGDTKKMEYYAKGIRKFQRELKISVSEFPRFALLGQKMPEEPDLENYWPDNNSCSQTQKELEDYRLQELAEDPYRFELEDDLAKEQEEYFRRIRKEWMDPGSTE
ncbi:MAG TPA: hypothetical protein VEL70_07320 [Candidatus Acidoferrum sp.]|nr:hypothetical protein [Candidatus Acidoferrum sp.]